jgi:hypothetical protein
MIVSVNEENG